MILEQFKSIRYEDTSLPESEMGFVGDPQVIANIVKKNQLLKMGDPTHLDIRTVWLGGSGGQQGVYQGANGIGFERKGIVDAIDSYVGVSCGVGAAYYMLGGHAALGTSIYTDDNAHNKLFNLKRPRQIYDADTLEWVFRYEKPVDYNYFRSRRLQLLVGITDAITGEGKFVNVKELDDPLTALMASMNIPIVNGGKIVEIGDESYFDGSLAYPLPISWIIENLHPTDLLIVLAGPLEQIGRGMEKLGMISRFFGVSKPVQKLLKTFAERQQKELAYLTGETPLPEGVRIITIYPTRSSLNAQSTNRRLLLQAAQTAQQFTEDLIDAHT